MTRPAHTVAFRTSLIYAAVGSAWIAGSNRALALMMAGSPDLLWVQTYKGWGFVAVTAVLLYYGLRTQLTRREREIAARAQVEAELRHHRSRLQLAATAGNIGFWDYDYTTRSVYHSPEWKAQLGYADHELASNATEWESRLHPEDRPRVLKALADCVEDSGGRYQQEYRILHRDGSYRWILAQGSIERDAAGRPLRLLGSHVDVTLTKQAEKALEQRAELNSRLAQIAAAVPGVIISYVRYPDGRHVFPYTSPAAEEIYGIAGDVIAANADVLFAAVSPVDLARVAESIDRSERTLEVWRCEFRYIHPQRGEIWLEGCAIPARQRDGATLWNGFVMDVTARKQSELRLRENEERFRQLAENIREVFWLTDPATHQVLYVSPVYETVWGRPVESLYANPSTWTDSLHPQDRERVVASVRERRMSGTYDEEYRIVRPDASVRWIRARAFPVRDAAGKMFRLAGFAEDITERKQLEEQFLRAQRLDALGTLAGGIAHDLNNVLAPIMMCAPMLRMGLRPAEVEKMVGTIEASTRRGADLVRQLLIFGRGVEGGRRPVSAKTAVDELEKIARETFPKNITVLSFVPEQPWMLQADATQVHQVLLNLSLNARDAMPHGGELTVAAENITLDAAAAASHPNARPGRYVRFRVTDTGTGISPEILDKIFDPFFTTKPLGKGTGLGLSTVLGIAKSHGGFVAVRSVVGAGTTFDVYLPTAVDAAAVADALGAAPPRGQGELVLLVEDEQSIREVVADLLIRHGYQVVTAEDGIEAERVFKQNVQAVRVIVTDLDMPRMDGLGLVQAVRQLKESVPIVVSSGLRSGRGGSDRIAQLDQAGVAAVLAKPYTTQEILQTVHRALLSAGSN